MSQTVIGFFNDHADAQRSLEQLQSSGISRDRVDITKGSSAGGVGHLDTSNTSSDRNMGDTPNPVSGSTRDENSVRRDADGRTLDPNDRNTNKFTDFFNNLFGGSDKDDHDEAGRFNHVAQRSGAIVTVHAQSREEAERAAGILDACGADDVDERAEQSGYSNNRTMGTGENLTRSGAGMRSRIIDRRMDDEYRLRD